MWGCGNDEPHAEIREGAYRAYIEENAAELVRATQAMLPELEHGEVGRAQSRFVRARVRYSQIEPAAETLPQLNASIDSRQAGGSGSAPGFHGIEKPLFGAETTRGTVVVAKQMIADGKVLRQRLAEQRFSAEELAAGSARLLDDVATSKLAGREQLYAEADLVDVSANLEAVGAAVTALEPALTGDEREEIKALLRQAYAEIGKFGTPARDPDQPRDLSPGAIFVVFGELSPEEVDELRQPVEQLEGAFEQLQRRLDEN
ncbi:MAG: EfeM/EfeO family lipoprotein [Solirubrobacterales bacterium]